MLLTEFAAWLQQHVPEIEKNFKVFSEALKPQKEIEK